jgi:hypothetical protein
VCRGSSRRCGPSENVAKYGDHLAVWSLRPDLDFIAFKKEGLGEQGIRSTNDMESINASSEKLILACASPGFWAMLLSKFPTKGG